MLQALAAYDDVIDDRRLIADQEWLLHEFAVGVMGSRLTVKRIPLQILC